MSLREFRNQHLDLILCNWPFLGVLVIPIVGLTNNFQGHPILEVVMSVLYGGGWLFAIGYALLRVSQQGWKPKRVIAWTIGLLWFSLFTMPVLYWKHLRIKPNPNLALPSQDPTR